MRGTGKADVFVMLAHPVGHAKSPGIFNEIFEQRGLDSLMVPLSCRPEDFDTFWAGITAAENVRGVIVSVPYKTAVFHKCGAAHDRAARVKSANSVRRQADGSWYADNFDGVGFIDGLRAGGHRIEGQRILQVGAGGAGASLAYCLAEAGAGDIRLHDIDEGRASQLAGLVAEAFPACRIAVGPADAAGMDMAINATPSGLRASDPLPFDVSRLSPETTVVDIIMEPAETALLRAAKAIGCPVQPGRPMMDFQVQAMAEFFNIDRARRNHE
ncbi:shikimate dehydrogenase [Pseudochelatococcus lubricantis]|uniref:Shikimate dehydrogenase n=1 Tax=Pseudochelatococcus lubricantis TaxID=1538102 RepID=A0ABX0V1P6_9HYPH|nr:shikimate dehydrogenase [Pseudochelatococcus lubricantis]NIJ59062.1 shikimate dehydrogenase [Pseudochelatococcus lubricantis]